LLGAAAGGKGKGKGGGKEEPDHPGVAQPTVPRAPGIGDIYEEEGLLGSILPAAGSLVPSAGAIERMFRTASQVSTVPRRVLLGRMCSDFALERDEQPSQDHLVPLLRQSTPPAPSPPGLGLQYPLWSVPTSARRCAMKSSSASAKPTRPS